MRRNVALEFLDSDLIDPILTDDRTTIPLDASLEDFSAYAEGIETRQQMCPEANQANSAQSKIPGLMIFKDAECYQVYISLMQLRDCADHEEYVSLILWLRSLTAADTVVFHLFGSCQKVLRFTLLDYATLLNTIFVSQAKTVCHVDFSFQGISSYIAIACKEVCLTPFARLTFDNLIPPDAQIPSIKAFSGFIQDLLDGAIEKKILSVEETEQVKDNRPVTLPYVELKSRILSAS